MDKQLIDIYDCSLTRQPSQLNTHRFSFTARNPIFTDVFTTMPALKNKTNLPNLDRRESQESSLPPKKKPYSRKTDVAEKVASKGSDAKPAGSRVTSGAKKDVPAGTVKGANQGGKAKRQLEVEVIIERPIKASHQDKEDEDELASDSDDSEHSTPKATVSKVPSRSINVTRKNKMEVEEDAGNEVEEPKFWQGGSQESIDDLLDNLLKSDGGNAERKKRDTGKKTMERLQVPIGRSTLPSDKDDKNSATATAHPSDLPVASMPPPRSATSATDLAVAGAPDLAHAVVIKVIEHALRKNIDWFTMSKELEAEGFKNGKVATLRGKGKGKGSKANDGHGAGSDSTTVRQTASVKMDGNSLCKSLVGNIPVVRKLTYSRLVFNR
jgi:hypothetical protein